MRSEGLLRNILPEEIAERLKNGERVIADRYEAVTVLFVDVVGFTPLAQRLSAEDLVVLLDRVFRELDALSERYGLEKIKTVGDAYIAVAGLPDADGGPGQRRRGRGDGARGLRRGRAGRAASTARSGCGSASTPARSSRGHRPAQVRLRHVGDAVNVASRMESQGVADRIQVSLDTYDLLQGRYRFRFRGTIEVKGRGEMAAYFLLGRRET